MNSERGRTNASDSLKDEAPGELPHLSYELLMAVLTASRDGIVIEAKERIVEVSPAAVRLLGYASASELVGHPVSVFCSAPGEKQLLESNRQQSKDGLHELLRLVAKRKDGTLLELEAVTKAVTIAGSSHRIIVLRDLTLRTSSEAQQLETVGRVTKDFAHDLNNLLTAIRCQTELVLVYENVPHAVREMLQKVITVADRATNLTSQLRAFARRQPMQPTSVDLNALISKLAKMFQSRLGDSIELRLDAAPNLPPIHADPNMLEQSILELALNAREAMPKGGILKLATAVFQPDDDYLRRQPAARKGEFVILTASDTATGVAPELTSVFEATIANKAAGKGNGLSLAKALNIVQQHQGWMDVESQVGNGTSIRMFIPARRDLASASVRPSQEPAAIAGGNETLLVVAHDRELRALIRLTLQKLGYQVLEAASWVESLKMWASHVGDIRLVLTELLMPGEPGGYELIKRLRLEKSELKGIVMSGCAGDIPEVDLELLPGLRVLSKPFDPVSLAHLIRSCLDEKRGPAGCS
jgi:two-component system, cell cycle sensor histidine kinase and response regulator CckA